MILKENSFLFWSLKEYALDICDILQIECPRIKIKSGKETNATYYPHLNTIEISDIYEDDYQLCYVIAHELRHVWQIEKGYFKPNDYIELKDCSNPNDYFTQPIEMDANAFSLAINFAYLTVLIDTFEIPKHIKENLLPIMKRMLSEIAHDKCPRFTNKTVLN